MSDENKVGMNVEPEQVEVCDNVLFVEIGVIPSEKGEGYEVAKVNCPRLPFYGRKVEEQVLGIVRRDPAAFRDEIAERLEAFAKELELGVTPKVSVNKDPALTPRKDEVYEGGGLFNLFVDMGSTNAKWMVAAANDDGATLAPASIGADKTASVCARWGIRYDKKAAYRYTAEQFNDWLMSAVLIFVRKIQHDRKEYACNVFWAFPKSVAGIPNAPDIAFPCVSDKVTEKLREYGLRGRFTLIPEATALDAMFRNRVLHLTIASEQEVQTNKQGESDVYYHNQEENRKVSENKEKKEKAQRKYNEDMASWRRKHSGFWGTIGGWFSNKPTEEYVGTYIPQYKTWVNRLELKDFRNTGIDSNRPFGMLFLDAGGSTFDYCYIPEGGGNAVSGSYLAGGKHLTERLQEALRIEKFEDAEERKLEYFRSAATSNAEFRKATQDEYEPSLVDLSEKVRGHGQYLCVVCTGLAMRNSHLRELVREKLSLAQDQKMIWSEDIAKTALDATSATAQYPDLKEFERIVRRLQDEGQSSPAYDVIGGLCFASKEGGRK